MGLVQPISPDEYRRNFPKSSAASIARITKAYAAWLRSAEPQPAAKTLDRSAPGKKAVSSRRGERYQIIYRVFNCQPCDFDNYHTKFVTDALVASGIIPRDDWDALEGKTVSEKAHTRKEQRTEIEIVRLK
jgi:hypothetical protein